MLEALHLNNRRLFWTSAILISCILTWFFFRGVSQLGLDVHDADTFADNQAIDQDWTFFFSSDKAQQSGRPTAELFKWLAYKGLGTDPAAFHWLVVALHLVASWLLVWLCVVLGLGRWVGMTAGLLFLTNVAHFYAVYHISALDYPLALCLGLVALSCYFHWQEHRQKSWFSGFAVAMILATGSHPAAVFILPLLGLLGWQRGWPLRSLAFDLIGLGVPLVILIRLLLNWTQQNTTSWDAYHTISSAIPAGRSPMRLMGEAGSDPPF